MTPVQLPEVPAPMLLGVRGLIDDAALSVSDAMVRGYTAAQLREYATEAVIMERKIVASAINMQAVADAMHRWMADLIPNGDLLHASVVCDYAGAQIFKRHMAQKLTELITPSETNSER